MARNESDREDLIREAIAMIRRTELVADDLSEPITIGFRSNGAMSVFVGQDPVYQFDPAGRLRRAYVGGSLFRSQHSTLAKLTRRRTPEQTILQRHDLNTEELQQFRRDMGSCLTSIRIALSGGRLKQVRTVPADADLIPEILNFLTSIDYIEDWLAVDIRARK
jgi:hypothetical protein